jgi:peptidoglycan/xylan/chitin deacetylase (PgdA/CDA1 family)
MGATTRGHVALTFDDGPHPATTIPLLEALYAGGALATFFIWGEHAVRHPDLLRTVRSTGMWIGNHTYTHPYLTRLRESAVLREIGQTQQIIRQITGLRPTLFRPPFGDTNAKVRWVAAHVGLAEVLWTVDTRDWAGASTRHIVRAAAAVQPGGIILMHDNGFHTTVRAVPEILSVLADRGLAPGKIEFPAARAVAP